MCVIIFKPANVQKPSYETLEACYYRNSDGIGFCTESGTIRKTMNFQTFIHCFDEVDDREAAIIHFRWATHGSIAPKNCHPFYDRAHDVYFAHNGIIDIRATRDRTDSETWFTDRFIPMLEQYGWDSKTLWDWVRVEAAGNRFVFMRQGEVKRFGTWHEVGGCYFSNLNWQFTPCWPAYGQYRYGNFTTQR